MFDVGCKATNNGTLLFSHDRTDEPCIKAKQVGATFLHPVSCIAQDLTGFTGHFFHQAHSLATFGGSFVPNLAHANEPCPGDNSNKQCPGHVITPNRVIPDKVISG
jgi:hypothetical protein